MCPSMKFLWFSSLLHIFLMFRILVMRGIFFAKLLNFILAWSYGYETLSSWRQWSYEALGLPSFCIISLVAFCGALCLFEKLLVNFFSEICVDSCIINKGQNLVHSIQTEFGENDNQFRGRTWVCTHLFRGSLHIHVWGALCVAWTWVCAHLFRGSLHSCWVSFVYTTKNLVVYDGQFSSRIIKISS
jgi:hypothetical protein